MRTSLNDIQTIEKHLSGEMTSAEDSRFNERLLHDDSFRMNVSLQRQMMSLLKHYHRKKLRSQIDEVQRRLFEDPVHAGFKYYIQSIFKS